MDWVSHLLGKGFMDKVFPREKIHKVESNTIYQDYKSAILLEDNGKDPHVSEPTIWIFLYYCFGNRP